MSTIYHVLSRGVDKRKIFLDDQDRFRFIHDLFEFNNQERVNTTFYEFNKYNDIASRKIKIKRRERKLLVNIHAFTLMSNHYHILLSPKIDGGIAKFMKKLNMGYAKYFDEKYDRKGALFEGRYKRVLVTSDAHLTHLPFYIHLNPLDLFSPEWRDRKLKNYKESIAFLNRYRWSSHMDYCGIRNFPSVTNRSFLLEIFGKEKGYKESLEKWLGNLDLESLEGATLE